MSRPVPIVRLTVYRMGDARAKLRLSMFRAQLGGLVFCQTVCSRRKRLDASSRIVCPRFSTGAQSFWDVRLASRPVLPPTEVLPAAPASGPLWNRSRLLIPIRP